MHLGIQAETGGDRLHFIESRVLGARRADRDQNDRVEEKPKHLSKSRCVSAHETRRFRSSFCPRSPCRLAHEHILNAGPRPVPCLWLRPCNGVRLPGGFSGALTHRDLSARACQPLGLLYTVPMLEGASIEATPEIGLVMRPVPLSTLSTADLSGSAIVRLPTNTHTEPTNT